MDYAFLGRSGLNLSRLGFGTSTFGTPFDGILGALPQVDVPGAQRMIGLCRDAGINYFDAADVYTAGEAETVLGKALGSDRQHVVIGTKATAPMGPGVHDCGSSRLHLIRACEDSLRRLGTDWIDLYMLHFPDSLTPIEETLRALDHLVQSGKVRYIGCCNFSGWQLVQGAMTSKALGLEPMISQQVSYSLVDRDAEHELVPAALDQGLGTMVWAPLAGGFLSGKYERDKDMPEGSRLKLIPEFPAVRDWEKGHDILDVMRKISNERGRPVAEVALNWVLRKPWVTTALLGARTEDQLVANLKAAEWTLTEDEVKALDEVSAPIVPYPYHIQQAFNGHRSLPLPAYRG